MPLTESQKQELRTAIEKAEGPGQCRYLNVDKTAPRCVIAQLLSARGVPNDVLAGIQNKLICSVLDGTLDCDSENMRKAAEVILASVKDLNAQLLDDLQSLWDRCPPPDEAATRSKMLALVEAA